VDEWFGHFELSIAIIIEVNCAVENEGKNVFATSVTYHPKV
jgi:hypothetical protein